MFKTPILLLVYNRSKYLKKLLNILQKIKAQNIYVSFDGPKKDEKDIFKCQKVIEKIDKINWKCNVQKNHLDKKKFIPRNLFGEKIPFSRNRFQKNDELNDFLYSVILEMDILQFIHGI